ELSAFGGELAEAEGYYISQVNLCMHELADFEVDEDMMSDVQMLQDEFEELKTELGRGADKEKIIAAMIENYRFRLEILKNILQELNEKNHDDEQVMA
ncbi:MAG: putative component of type VI protein secretion system, partial [Flavobacteriales bacterium]